MEVLTLYEWNCSVCYDSNSVTIKKFFNKNDNNAFLDADNEAGVILTLCALSSSSVWGTGPQTVDGFYSLQKGEIVYHKKGRGKKFLKALQRLIISNKVKFS